MLSTKNPSLTVLFSRIEVIGADVEMTPNG